MWFAVITGMISFFGLFILAGSGVFGEMPEFEQLENPNTNLATQIISSDGEILGKFYLMITEHQLHIMSFLKT